MVKALRWIILLPLCIVYRFFLSKIIILVMSVYPTVNEEITFYIINGVIAIVSTLTLAYYIAPSRKEYAVIVTAIVLNLVDFLLLKMIIHGEMIFPIKEFFITSIVSLITSIICCCVMVINPYRLIKKQASL